MSGEKSNIPDVQLLELINRIGDRVVIVTDTELLRIDGAVWTGSEILVNASRIEGDQRRLARRLRIGLVDPAMEDAP